MSGVPARHVARLREAAWRAYGLVAPDLIAGRANWTTAPAPTATWAAAVFSAGGPKLVSGLPSGVPASAVSDASPTPLMQLWSTVFETCRVDAPDPLAAWREHLGELERQRDQLNDRRAAAVRFTGEGTDLVVPLAPTHVWCVAALRMRDGRQCVANLPTEEIFTAPHRDGAEGIVRIARPVAYGGGVMADVELEFRAGEVVRAQAGSGDDLLRRLLATDGGAARLGEVALVPRPQPALSRDGVCFQHTLLDENALPHIALGEGYPFSVRSPGAAALNHSLVHVDLPIAARATLVDAEGR